MENNYYSNLQEKQIASKLGGKTQPNSGGTRFGGGDVKAGCFLIEAKTTTKNQNSLNVRKEWLEKVKEQAFEQGLEEYAVAIRFNPNENKDYYLIDDQLMKQIIDKLEE